MSARNVATTTDVVHVAVVVDFGPGSGLSPRVVIRCFTVTSGSNGSDVLADVATTADVVAPTYNDSGLLCSIDGYPTRGCGAVTGGGVAYWSYWHGGSSWSYANVGPAEWAVHNDDVEGWRFDAASSGTAADPPPNAPSSYTAACASANDTAFPLTTPPKGTSTTSAIVAGIAGLLIVILGAASVRRWRRRVP
jgi:hypothetical protein